MSSRVTDTNTTSPALVADDSFVHHQSPYDDANHNRRFLGLPPPHSPPAAVEDIHRGSLINFYNSVHDPHLLASWASFFRDQYLMTNCELHKAKFLHTVEKDILSCSSLEAVFRGNPFVGSKNFPDDCFQVIFRMLSNANSQSGDVPHPFNNPAWKKFLWEGQVGSSSLCTMILDAHSVHQERYAFRICEAVEAFLNQAADGYEQELARHALLSACFQCRDLTTRAQYETVKAVYAIIHGSNKKPMAPISDVVANLGDVHQELEGKLVSDIFTIEEEGFILASMGFHLISDVEEGPEREMYTMMLGSGASKEESKQSEGMDVNMGNGIRLSFVFSFPSKDVAAKSTKNEQDNSCSTDMTTHVSSKSSLMMGEPAPSSDVGADVE